LWCFLFILMTLHEDSSSTRAVTQA